MIGLSFNIDNLDTVMTVYDEIQLVRYQGSSLMPESPIGVDITSLTDWVTVSGTATFPVPIKLIVGNTVYNTYDPMGEASDYFSSRYHNSSTGSISGWSDPVLGESSEIYYSPDYSPEISYGSEDQNIINQIRLWIGDPVGINRTYGEEALGYIHPDHKTFQMPSKGWPVFITLNGQLFNSVLDPTVNGYKYLRFKSVIDSTCVTYSGVVNPCGAIINKEFEEGIDIWWYTFRYSDREIMRAYDNCLPPIGLTIDNATPTAYLLQTSINLLQAELLSDATESGAAITDDKTSYNPAEALKIRKALLDDLKKQLDNLVKTLLMARITGVLID